MDEKDRQILDILKENGRASYTEIAENVDVSEGTVRNRVEKMKENGVIERFTVETADTGSRAVVMVKIDTGVSVEKIADSLPADIRMDEVTGDFDLIIRFSRDDNGQLNRTLDKIRETKGVRETRTYTVLESHEL